jgi:hypothetical protein
MTMMNSCTVAPRETTRGPAVRDKGECGHENTSTALISGGNANGTHATLKRLTMTSDGR